MSDNNDFYFKRNSLFMAIHRTVIFIIFTAFFIVLFFLHGEFDGASYSYIIIFAIFMLIIFLVTVFPLYRKSDPYEIFIKNGRVVFKENNKIILDRNIEDVESIKSSLVIGGSGAITYKIVFLDGSRFSLSDASNYGLSINKFLKAAQKNNPHILIE